ncbi:MULTISPECIES: hypothetical protein [unclassified Streptomyces]|uniref:hypothetical protein n=1 Tax=unclassified Streptomyces TaxID=2593676 RepID=UPI0006AEFE14|nr:MULTISPECIES: hypothetical protein [unclassified Streptomyces]KOX34273.1 hypothetical protein ADL06_07745 [Streptomyces sp. NRRL F-6491]KOX42307.1 hypothetical protein ADL08_16505 [Streptomyces sp. NRRL F-6492]
MSITVPSCFKPSGGLVQPYRHQETAHVPAIDLTRTGRLPCLLNGIPAQPKPLPVAATPGERCTYCKQPAPYQHTGATGITYWLCDGCNEATALYRTVHTARFERATFDLGVKMVYKKVDATTLRVGYDPAEMTSLDARLALGIFAAFTEGEKVDKLVELARDTDVPASREIFTILLDHIDETGDVDGVLSAVTELFERSYNQDHPEGRCPRHTWCIETGQHVEHTGESVEPDFLDVDCGEVLAAGITHWGDKGVRVGFLNDDLTPANARTRLAELRAQLDTVEKLIDTAEVTR